MTMTATNVDALRQGWEDAVSTLAPGVDELPILLETRLAEAVRDRRLDEPALLSVVDEAWRVASKKIAPEESGHLARRMQQAIYEYLLSLDAIVEPEEGPVEFETSGSAGSAILIGAEEVVQLRGEEPAETALAASPVTEAPAEEVEAVAAQPEATELAAEDPATGAEAPVAAEVTPAPEPPPTPEATSQADAETKAEAEMAAEGDTDADAAAEPEAPEESDPELAEPPKRRFTLFRRNGSATSFEADEPATDGEYVFAEPEESEVSPTAASEPPLFVAPKAGFHITEFSDAATAPPDPGTLAPLPPPIVRSAEPAPARASNGSGGTKSWHIRNLRPGKKQRDEAAPAEAEPAEDADEELATGLSVSESRFDTDPEVVEARRQINDRLRHRRCDEAASLLQRLATELGGKEVAELALDAGDRCRALGKTNAALSCYLAASRADPVHETPLLRLADICLDDKDIDLAVSYLERVARLHRLRGDQKGALRVYRKIATVAPYRDDIMNLLMHVQATGRFEDE
jgi:hypothetical protein